MSIDDAMEEAKASAKTRGQDMAGRLMEQIGSVATAQAVFGAPVDRDGITVIPVARVRWGAGGGGGEGGKEREHGEGGGGGGGVSATPMGHIQLAGGKAEFVRIRDITGMWPLLLAAGGAVWLVLRGIRALVQVSR